MLKVFTRVSTISTITTLLLCLLLAASFASAASLAAEAIGEVVYMAGTVRAQQPNSTARDLDLESPIFPRDTVVTSRYSQVEIRFKDGTILAQGNDAEISLDDYVYSTDVSASKLLFKMSTGTFRVVTGEIVKLNPEAFILQTRFTTLGIRGTQPFIKIEEDASDMVGVIELTPGYTVSVTSARQTVSFDRAGLFTNINRDGEMSDPAPTPPAVQRAIQRAAPMTSLGELGARGSKDDMKRKVKTFEKHVEREKKGIGDHDGHGDDGHPDYGSIHHITVQQTGLKNAKDQKEGKSSAISDGSSSLGGDHPDDGHPDDGDDGHGDDHGDGGGGH